MKKRDLVKYYYLNYKKALKKFKYCDTHKNEISAYSKGYYVSHRDERLELFSDYHYSHRDKRIEQFSDYQLLSQ